MAYTTSSGSSLLDAPLSRPLPGSLLTTPSFERALSANKVAKRPRSSSVLNVTKIRPNYDDTSDLGGALNPNADWVNLKGAWSVPLTMGNSGERERRQLIHVFFIILGKVLLSILPGIDEDFSWTILNLSYIIISYIVFHGVKGVPTDLTINSGGYEGLTLWEQIDAGAHYTPAKKWLTTLPIVLFLLSTHYTTGYFALNLSALVFVGLAPKLPYFHRLRFKFFDKNLVPEPSAPPTPVETSMAAGERDFGLFYS
ncbi:hypothetical protein RQP46_008534 [Phenoliferia psychrophenolica]